MERKLKSRKSMFIATRNPSGITAFDIFPVEPVPTEASKKIVYEQSHPLGPKKLFSRDKAEKIMKITMEEMLGGQAYDEFTMGKLSKSIANEIREKLKNNYRRCRYKFVVTVYIVEEKQQDLIVSRKQLHSAESDASAEIIYRSPTFVAYAYCVAFYQE